MIRTCLLAMLAGMTAACQPATEQSEAIPTPGNVSIPVNADKRGPEGYRPNPLVVKQGATVTWTNHDSIWHTVTSDTGGAFASEPIPARGTFSRTFTASGTFPYHCAIPGHDMTGAVVVEP